ncbi:hypothetical protein EVAR_16590_1 [Eumeta japonica]|uniref:Uncharacterized protein n=1 Tax=Eumeta variegata TaxID=151549 RepID=A0A4C1U3T1_EUMVA|nr:hypothetical protein EVAR_16590_1 [Eumeta japonica]
MRRMRYQERNDYRITNDTIQVITTGCAYDGTLHTSSLGADQLRWRSARPDPPILCPGHITLRNSYALGCLLNIWAYRPRL